MASEPSACDVVARLRAAGCVFAEDEARLLIEAAGPADELEQLVRRRCAGVPLEHLLGWAEFYGQRVAVAPGVFVPRRRTELVVRAVLDRLAPAAVVVELCCGAAAISTALLTAMPGLEAHAADIDPAAADCARRNLDPLGGHVHCGDLYDPLPRGLLGRVDVLVANAPYVPTDEIELMPAEARLHEPRVALDGGSDGLYVARRIVRDAPAWLAPAGHLLIETSDRQAPVLAAAAADAGLRAEVVTDAELGGTALLASRAA